MGIRESKGQKKVQKRAVRSAPEHEKKNTVLDQAAEEETKEKVIEFLSTLSLNDIILVAVNGINKRSDRIGIKYKMQVNVIEDTRILC